MNTFVFVVFQLAVSIFLFFNTSDFLWVASSFLFAGAIIIFRGEGRLNKIILVILSSIFSLLNIMYAVSYYFQGEGFNDRFVFHLHSSSIDVAVKAFPFAFFGGLVLWLMLSASPMILKSHSGRISKVVALLLITVSISLSTPFGSAMNLVLSQESRNIEDAGETTERPPVELDESPDKRNLIFIYAESLEKTYSSTDTFGSDQTPELTALAKAGMDFNNLIQVPGTGWTMGGIVASQCGKSMGVQYGVNSLFATIPTPLPTTVCLGDILKGNGYSTEFWGGATLNFGGKGNYLKAHGFERAFGREELDGILDDPDSSGWGIYDDALLETAIGRVAELEKQSKPYLLTVLTLDTHHPSGYPSPSCNNQDNDFLSTVRCSDELISEFISKIRNAYPDTVIVLLSDHLSMKNPVFDVLQAAGHDRRLRFNIWAEHLPNMEIDKQGTHFDVAPTVLEALGFNSYHELANGASLISRKSSWFEDKGKLGMVSEDNEYLRNVTLPNSVKFIRSRDKSYVQIGDEKFVASNEGHRLNNAIFALAFDESGRLKKIIDNRDHQLFQNEANDDFIVGLSMNEDFNKLLGIKESSDLAYFIGNLRDGRYISSGMIFEKELDENYIKDLQTAVLESDNGKIYNISEPGEVIKSFGKKSSKLIIPYDLDSVTVERRASIWSVNTDSGYSQLNKIDRLSLNGQHLALVHENQSSEVSDIVFAYRLLLGRIPDPEGLGYWINEIENGGSVHQVVKSMVGSEEFANLNDISSSYIENSYVPKNSVTNMLENLPSYDQSDALFSHLYEIARNTPMSNMNIQDFYNIVIQVLKDERVRAILAREYGTPILYFNY